MSTYNDSLWDIASADHQAEHETGIIAAASVEAAPVLAFLIEAESSEDFGNRLALMDDHIHAVAASVAGLGTADYTTVVTTLPQQFFEHWQTAFAARQAEAQKRNARRAYERRQARAKTAATQQQFDADLAKYQDALEGGGWIEQGTDPDGTPFFYIKPGAPPDLVRGYQGLMEYGYANGLVAARRTAAETTCSQCGAKIVEVDGTWLDDSDSDDASARVCPKGGGDYATHSPARTSRRRTAAETQKVTVYLVQPPEGLESSKDLNRAINDTAHPRHEEAYYYYTHAFGMGGSYDPNLRYVEAISYDAPSGLDDQVICDKAFEEFNVGTGPLAQEYRNNRNRSLSTGDIVVVGGRAWFCASFGWERVTNFKASARTHGEPGFCEVCGHEIRPGPNKGTFVHYDSLMELAHTAVPNQATTDWYSQNAPEYLASKVAYDENGRRWDDSPYAGRDPLDKTCPACGGKGGDCKACAGTGQTTKQPSPLADLDPKGARRTALSDSNAWPPKDGMEDQGSPQAAPPASPSATQQPGAMPAQSAGGTAGAIQQGDVLLDAADGQPHSYEVTNVQDQGDSVLVDVTKDGAEQMQLQIPKTEQVNVLPTTGGTPDAPISEPQQVPPGQEGDPSAQTDLAADPAADPAAAGDDVPFNPFAQGGEGKTEGEEAPEEGVEPEVEAEAPKVDAESEGEEKPIKSEEEKPEGEEKPDEEEDEDKKKPPFGKDSRRRQATIDLGNGIVAILPKTAAEWDVGDPVPYRFQPNDGVVFRNWNGAEAEGNVVADPAPGMPNDAFVEFRPKGGDYSYPVNRNQLRINSPGAFRGHNASQRTAEDGAPNGPAWFEENVYRTAPHSRGPKSGVPEDLFPDGIPLRGDLTPEQQAWLDKRSNRHIAMPNPVDLGVKVGDIFECSWGYDQTNIDFYEVVRLTPQSVVIRQVRKTRVSSEGQGHRFVPDKGNYVGEPMTRRIQTGWRGTPYISINSFSGASLWDGTPSWETDSMFGH